MPISVVYPHNRHLSSKVRVFVDWVAELFGECPLMSGGDASAERLEHASCQPASDTIRRMIEDHNLAESVF